MSTPHPHPDLPHEAPPAQSPGRADDDPVRIYREGLAQGELRFQRCDYCGSSSAQLRLLCATCGGTEFSWERSGGRGRVHALPRPLGPAAAPDTGALTGVVELDEGLRIRALFAPVAAYRLWPGARVELEVDAADGSAPRPVFRPAA